MAVRAPAGRATRALLGRVIAERGSDAGPSIRSFHEIEIAPPNRRMALLFNAAHPRADGGPPLTF